MTTSNTPAGAGPNFTAGAGPNFTAGAGPNFIAGAGSNAPNLSSEASFDAVELFLETRFPDPSDRRDN